MEISKDLQEELLSLNRGRSWESFDEARHGRYDHLFNPSLHEDPDLKQFVDLDQDEALNHYQVSKLERRKLQWETEFLMDNVVAAGLREQRQAGTVFETTTTGSIAANTTWMLPMVRQYMPRMFLRQIVPSYPMNQPTGKMFTADSTYGTGGAYASGTSIFTSFDQAYADDNGECTAPNELNYKITDTDITAISKKLKGVWSIEAAQNLQAYHKMVMETEVIKMLGMQINREVDRYGINQLVGNAATHTNWNSAQPMATASGWSNANPREYNESLWDAIEDANRAIKDAKYVNANFILCGTQFASRLRKLNGFRLAHSGDPVVTDVLTGPNMYGSLNGRYKLYEDVDFPDDKALIGHKPSSWQYTGAALNMFVPVWRSPVVHTTSMCPGIGYMTRFAFTVISGSFFGTLGVS